MCASDFSAFRDCEPTDGGGHRPTGPSYILFLFPLSPRRRTVYSRRQDEETRRPCTEFSPFLAPCHPGLPDACPRIVVYVRGCVPWSCCSSCAWGGGGGAARLTTASSRGRALSIHASILDTTSVHPSMGAYCQVAEVHRRVTAAWRAPALGALLLMWVWPIVSLLYDALGGGQGRAGTDRLPISPREATPKVVGRRVVAVSSTHGPRGRERPNGCRYRTRGPRYSMYFVRPRA